MADRSAVRKAVELATKWADVSVAHSAEQMAVQMVGALVAPSDGCSVGHLVAKTEHLMAALKVAHWAEHSAVWTVECSAERLVHRMAVRSAVQLAVWSAESWAVRMAQNLVAERAAHSAVPMADETVVHWAERKVARKVVASVEQKERRWADRLVDHLEPQMAVQSVVHSVVLTADGRVAHLAA
jgi:hypothetical protein